MKTIAVSEQEMTILRLARLHPRSVHRWTPEENAALRLLRERVRRERGG